MSQPAKELNVCTSSALMNLSIAKTDINMIYFSDGTALELTNWQVEHLNSCMEELPRKPKKRPWFKKILTFGVR